MSFAMKKMVASVVLALSVNVAMANTTTSSVEGFDFSYTVDLARDSKLVQAFDDGDRVYLQFSSMDELPTVYVENNGKRALAKLESKPPYLISLNLAQKFVLVEGKKETVIKYVGKRQAEAVTAVAQKAETATPVAASAPAKAPAESKPASSEKVPPKKVAETHKPRRHEDRREKRDESRDTYLEERRDYREARDSEYRNEGRRTAVATLINVPFFENSITVGKLVRKGVEDRLDKINKADRIIIQGRASVDGDYSTAKARSIAIRSLLEDLGVDYDRIEIEPITVPKLTKTEGFYNSEIILMPEGVGGEYADRSKGNRVSKYVDRSLKIKNGDLLSERLAEWAKANGYTLYWEADQYRATADFTSNKDFDMALESVKKAMAMNGVKLDISIYENHIVRIVEVK
jgi:hypothetical protein